MYRYAQINTEGYIVSDSYLSGEVKADNMIHIEADFDCSNKRYVDGKWETFEPSSADENQLTDVEAAVIQAQLNTEYLCCLAEINNM